jgi:hypothetical protein
LEDYLNFLGAPHNFGAVNNTNYTNLRVMTGNETNFVFTVANPTNGSVSLAADGITAQFFPATNFIGLAYFTFSATNPVNHSWFSPVLVASFVTNQPPIIVAQPANSTNAAGGTAQFSVGAANASLAYRWRRSGTNLLNSGNISGATNATLIISNVGAADATNYTVVVTNFSGAITSSPAALVITFPNMTPALAAISSRTVFAGVTVAFTNSATDTDSPPQTLTFSSQDFPAGATVNSSNGIFNWRPAIAQGGATNTLKIIVTDNGSPNLSATQSFSIGVLNPAKPQMANSIFSNGAFRFTFSGDAGPDYVVQSATNLAATNWPTLFATNPAALPFSWADTTAANFPQRFYRIQLGP